ncbi:MAG: T9SS type A sorting domain-containing protein, partial [Schleiferiaceae bacterium]
STIPLSLWNFSANPLNLRFRMGAGAGNSSRGWAIDDVQIYVPPQNSMAPINIDTKEYLIVPDQTSTVKVYLENTGAKPVSSILVRYKVNNGAWTTYDTLTFSPALPRGGRRWHEFSQLWLNNGAGTYSICVETSTPNGKQDNLVADDQLCMNFPVSDKIYIDATGYCNDFEDPAKAAWLPLHSTVKTAAHDWEFGTPGQTVISSAASGTKAWMTKLTSNYTPMGRSSLHTPFFVLDSNVVYTMKFDHNMFSEQYHDGGSIDWSYNGGINWYTLGNVLPSGKWYNTVHVTSLDNIRPGWSGTTNGWTPSSINFTADNSGTLVFRFRFGSDYTIVNEGWAIDNFCLQRAPLGTPADILNIGVPEASLGDAFLGGVSPNPTAGGTAGVDFQSNEGGTLRLTVYTMLGQPVFSQNFEHSGGLVRMEWETAELPAGLYNAVIEWNGQSYTRRFVR